MNSSAFDIYCATKAGDLDRVKYLCEVEDVDINKKNEFDSIPLFYACLCGHKGNPPPKQFIALPRSLAKNKIDVYLCRYSRVPSGPGRHSRQQHI